MSVEKDHGCRDRVAPRVGLRTGGADAHGGSEGEELYTHQQRPVRTPQESPLPLSAPRDTCWQAALLFPGSPTQTAQLTSISGQLPEQLALTQAADSPGFSNPSVKGHTGNK